METLKQMYSIKVVVIRSVWSVNTKNMYSNSSTSELWDNLYVPALKFPIKYW